MKRMFKKAISVFLVVVMLLCAAPLNGFIGFEFPGLLDFKAEAASYSGTCGDNLTWSLDTETGVLEITGTGAMTDWSSYSYIPWLSYPSNIKTVNIASGVTTIGNHAFEDCESLISVTIGNSVTTIGESAFYDCTSLTSVTIPDGVTTIGHEAFRYCNSLTSITIPDSVTTIGELAFFGCNSLTNITVDNNNKKFSSDSYGVLFNKNKTKLMQYPVGNTRKSYRIPDCVTIIDSFAFKNCHSLTSVTIGNCVTTIGEWAFHSCTSLTGVTIPDSVTTIGKAAFYNCTSLTNIIIPDSVITIGESVFEYCISLTSITIPNSVTSIGYVALAYCSGLTNVTIPDSVTAIGGFAFYGCTSLTSVTIPDSVTTIGDGAFGLCTSLTSVTIPDSVTTIGESAFENCTGLTSVTIGNSVTTIGRDAFDACICLTSVTIPDSVTTIGEGVFAYCYRLTSITIPDCVTSIGDLAFYECNSLTDVYYGGTKEEWNKITIGTDNEPLNSANIHFNATEEPTIASGECGDNLIWIFDSSTGVLTISGTGEMYNWEGNPSTNEFNVPWSSYSSDIRSVVIEDGVISIGDFSFFNCVNMTDISIADTVESIGSYTFAYCESLADITLPDSVTAIGYGTFIFCSKFVSIEIPQNVTCINASAFGGCSALTSITIPDSVITIGEYAFYLCDNLSDVYYGRTEEDWNEIAIGSDNEDLTSATIHYSYVKPSVAPANGAVVDDENGTIYGLDAGIDSLDSYTELADGYEWSYEEGQYGFGTGTVATLKNGNQIIAEYTVIIFGDIDGNGWYDANDAFLVNMLASGLISADRLSAAQFRAADCNHDGAVDNADFYLLNQASLMLEDIDQSATKDQLAANAMYISYCAVIDQTAGEETNLVPAPDLDDIPENSTTPEINETDESADEADVKAIIAYVFELIRNIFALIFSFVI